MKNKRKEKIFSDKNGRQFIKETYFVGGKMKFRRIYVIDGMSADEFYENNATELDFYLNRDHELINIKSDSNKNIKINDLSAKKGSCAQLYEKPINRLF